MNDAFDRRDLCWASITQIGRGCDHLDIRSAQPPQRVQGGVRVADVDDTDREEGTRLIDSVIVGRAGIALGAFL
jgi:hypothetical protein